LLHAAAANCSPCTAWGPKLSGFWKLRSRLEGYGSLTDHPPCLLRAGTKSETPWMLPRSSRV
jgi:hypothetical protein